MTFDLGFWTNEYLDFFQTFIEKSLNLLVFIHKVLISDYCGNNINQNVVACEQNVHLACRDKTCI